MQGRSTVKMTFSQLAELRLLRKLVACPIRSNARTGSWACVRAKAAIKRELGPRRQDFLNCVNKQVNVGTRIGRYIAEPLPTGNRRR